MRLQSELIERDYDIQYEIKHFLHMHFIMLLKKQKPQSIDFFIQHDQTDSQTNDSFEQVLLMNQTKKLSV